MMKRIKYILVVLCLVLLGNDVLAQGKITGKVFDDKSGSAVEYATVAVLNPKDSSLVRVWYWYMVCFVC